MKIDQAEIIILSDTFDDCISRRSWSKSEYESIQLFLLHCGPTSEAALKTLLPISLLYFARLLGLFTGQSSIIAGLGSFGCTFIHVNVNEGFLALAVCFKLGALLKSSVSIHTSKSSGELKVPEQL